MEVSVTTEVVAAMKILATMRLSFTTETLAAMDNLTIMGDLVITYFFASLKVLTTINDLVTMKALDTVGDLATTDILVVSKVSSTIDNFTTVGFSATTEVLATTGDLVNLPPQLCCSCPWPSFLSQPPCPLWTPWFPPALVIWGLLPSIVVTIPNSSHHGSSWMPCSIPDPGPPSPSPLTVMGTEFLLAGMLRTSLALPSRWVETRPWKSSALTGMRGAGELSGLVT